MNYSTTAEPSPREPNQLQKVMQQHPLIAYFVLAYAFSWIVSIPFILSEWGVLHGNYQAAFVIKGFGPYLSAIVMSRVLYGKQGFKQLRAHMHMRKAGWLWYVFVLIGIPLLVMAGILVQPGSTAGFLGFKPLLPVTYLFTYILVFFGGGPLGEEPGWRGFALPRLQEKYGPLLGTLILGGLWTCWHLPDFLTSAQGGGPGTGWTTFWHNFPIFLLLVMAFAFLLTWIYNRNHGSVFMTLLAHASINTPQVVLVPLFPAVGVTSLNLAALIGYGVPAVLILLLTRGQLGYQAGIDQIVEPGPAIVQP